VTLFRSISMLATMIVLGASTLDAQQPPGSAPAPHQHDMASHDANLFPTRDGSGTAWLPDDTPMHGVMKQWREWAIAIHGSVFAQVRVYEAHSADNLANTSFAGCGGDWSAGPVDGGRGASWLSSVPDQFASRSGTRW